MDTGNVTFTCSFVYIDKFFLGNHNIFVINDFVTQEQTSYRKQIFHLTLLLRISNVNKETAMQEVSFV